MPTPSLLIVPARFKTGKLYSQIPTSGAGDFTVTRNTTATRFNSAGLIESVASGIPRLDYYTSGGTAGCPALLVEPAATNGILNSADTRTSWTLGANLTSGAIDVIGVSGNNLTVAVSGSNIGAALGRLQRPANNVALASGSTYTISFFLKQTGTHTIGGYYALITGAAAGDLGAGFDVSGSFSSGSIYNSAGTTSRIRRVERWGTDVFRCSETFTMTASGTLTSLNFAPLVSVTSTINPAVGTQLGFAAPQIELGSVPTSFIPTTTGTGSRSADVISVSGAVSGSIGQTEGTLYVECDSSNGADDVIMINQSIQSAVILLKDANNSYIGRIIHGSGSPTFFSFTTATGTTGFVKIALAYKSGNSAMFMNGTQVGSTNTSNWAFTNALNRFLIDKATNFFAGLTTLQADPGTNRTALQAMTTVSESEYGALYVDESGSFVFQDRAVTAGSIGGTPTVFNDDGTGIKAHDYRIASLCYTCHDMIDNHKELDKQERVDAWESAHRKTIGWLFEKEILNVK